LRGALQLAQLFDMLLPKRTNPQGVLACLFFRLIPPCYLVYDFLPARDEPDFCERALPYYLIIMRGF
jgi:hypothetical protein